MGSFYSAIPQIGIATANANFTSLGLTSTNVRIIYLIQNPTKSFVPGRTINGITSFETGKGYYIIAKVDIELPNVLSGEIDFILANYDGNLLIDSDSGTLVVN
jgi:hypothetical protein